ncbi:hypothetical protein Hdeb2414_s0005g00167461 [Helianthus debilis subsp. tardiflorus]
MLKKFKQTTPPTVYKKASCSQLGLCNDARFKRGVPLLVRVELCNSENFDLSV